MRYSAQHKQETRQRLLKVAADAIREEGPHQVGVAGIMAKASLTHGGFYAHFASKDDLVAQAIGEMFEEMQARFLRETDAQTPADGLAAYIDFYLSRRHCDSPHGCPVASLLSDVRRVPDDARQAFSEGARRLKHHLADLLQRLHHDDADVAADTLMAELVGALMLARAEPDAKRSNDILMRSRQSLKRRFNLDSTPRK